MTNPTRREFLKQATGAAAVVALGPATAALGAAGEDPMKFSFCNEPFLGLKWPQAKIFQYLADCGYQGVEIAPFTINTDVTRVSTVQRSELRKAADRAGITICGLHWLLAKTEGLNLTSADRDTRRRTSRYLGELARFCADLGGNVMIFGSPKQRNRPKQMSMVEGYRNATDVLKAVVPVLEATGVTLAMEPLATWETNFILCADDAIRLDKMVGSPRVAFMLDCKAMWSMEPEPIPDVIRRSKGRFVHFHANDANLQGPGFGQIDFVPIFKALKEVKYDRWVSVEPLDYVPGAEKLARESIKYMRQCLAKA